MKLSALVRGLLPLVACTSALSTSAPFESLRAIPQGWTRLRPASPSSRIHLRIALHQPNHELFEQTLLAVSTPDHPSYGQHLMRDDLKQMLKPLDESTNAVLSWLKASGVPSADIEDDGDFINFYVSVSMAEKMMDTSFSVYSHSVDKNERIRTLQYSVPQNVTNHILMVQPTTRFGTMAAEKTPFKLEERMTAVSSKEVPDMTSSYLNATCNSTFTPSCLRALYNVGDYEADPSCGSLLGVCGYLKQWAKFDDLEFFLDKFAPYAKGANFSYELISGGLMTQKNTTQGDGEANGDIQYAVSIGYNTSVTYYSTGGLGELVADLDQPDSSKSQNEPYLDFLTYILKKPNKELPQTITTSYGENEQSVPEAYSRVVCNMFGQLGARGVSVIFSSGDTGVGSACQTNDGKNTTRFLPVFPASCPYVTSVGATYHIQPERAIYFSSGGFSDRFPRPSYQDSVVSQYLRGIGDTWKGLYNPNGRGFPDVAAQGYHYQIITKLGGTVQQVVNFSGTR
jgi:tripeptidyl-peptidase-1